MLASTPSKQKNIIISNVENDETEEGEKKARVDL